MKPFLAILCTNQATETALTLLGVFVMLGVTLALAPLPFRVEQAQEDAIAIKHGYPQNLPLPVQDECTHLPVNPLLPSIAPARPPLRDIPPCSPQPKFIDSPEVMSQPIWGRHCFPGHDPDGLEVGFLYEIYWGQWFQKHHPSTP